MIAGVGGEGVGEIREVVGVGVGGKIIVGIVVGR